MIIFLHNYISTGGLLLVAPYDPNPGPSTYSCCKLALNSCIGGNTLQFINKFQILGFKKFKLCMDEQSNRKINCIILHLAISCNILVEFLV